MSRDVHFHESSFYFIDHVLETESIFPSPLATPTLNDQNTNRKTPPNNPATTQHNSVPTPSKSPSLSPSLHNPVSPNTQHTPIPLPILQLRRSERESKMPRHLKNFVCNNVYLTYIISTCFAEPTKPSTFSFVALSIHN